MASNVRDLPQGNAAVGHSSSECSTDNEEKKVRRLFVYHVIVMWSLAF